MNTDSPTSIDADDRGFLLGDGLFETIRIYEGTPFRLESHLDRLRAGAAALGIEVVEDLESRIRSFIEEGPPDAALRITLSRGSGGDLSGEGAGPATLALRVRAVQDSELELTAVQEGWLHESSLSAGLKGLGYLERVLALRKARARGADEALVRNARAEIVEGSTSNLIAVLPRGELVAPGRRDGALPGITRAIVLKEAWRLGYRIEERGLRPGELAGIRELILTSSIRELAPVVEVEGRRVGMGRPGPVYQALRQAFREVVEGETGASDPLPTL